MAVGIRLSGISCGRYPYGTVVVLVPSKVECWWGRDGAVVTLIAGDVLNRGHSGCLLKSVSDFYAPRRQSALMAMFW